MFPLPGVWLQARRQLLFEKRLQTITDLSVSAPPFSISSALLEFCQWKGEARTPNGTEPEWLRHLLWSDVGADKMVEYSFFISVTLSSILSMLVRISSAWNRHTHTQINEHELLFLQKYDEWADYLSEEIIHKSLALHGNLNVIASSIALLLNTQTNKKRVNPELGDGMNNTQGT